MPGWAQTVPAASEILGYDIGTRFTDTGGIERFMEALAAASDLVSVDHYGETPEGRPLLQVLFASREHRADLDRILEANRVLTDPDTPEALAVELAASNPAVVYLTFGIHGSEAGASEAALLLAHDLASGAPEVSGVLESLIVVMDPIANPDGRDRYVNFYRQTAQQEPNPNPQIRARREPWPGGRYNHYLFDLNRDWAWLTQPETLARLDRFDRFLPQVHVDFHEMGSGSSYFFFPAADPINPIYPESVLEWGERFGAANAQAMDRAGLLYFTGQRFDLLYPGYGDSWPSLLGAIGMTYEQGGGGFAGRMIRRDDGSLLTLADRVRGHRTTAHATLRTAAEGRSDLLESFAGFHRTVDDALDDVYLVPGDDPGRMDALLRLLDLHSIQAERLDEEVTAVTDPYPGFTDRETLPAGTVRVLMRQPRGRLAGALLRWDNLIEPEPAPSDITGWTLPYAYGIEAHAADAPIGGAWSPVGEPGSPATGTGPGTGAYGYLLRPSFENMPALVRFLAGEGRAFVLPDSFTVRQDPPYPPGTVFIPGDRNQDLGTRLNATGLDTRVAAVTSGLVTSGPDLGTSEAAPLVLPRMALLGGEGTAPTGFGAHWHFLERVLGLPFDAVDVADLTTIDLDSYDVIAVPHGEPMQELSEEGSMRIDGWVRQGGTLVAVGAAARTLGASLVGVEERLHPPMPEAQLPVDSLDRALRTRTEREADAARERTVGTILEAALDPAHPLSFGVRAGRREDRVFVLSGGAAFEPSDAFESPVFFPEGVARISGLMSEPNLQRLDRSAWLVEVDHEDGRVILFADDPLFRGFWYSGFQLFTNAVLFAPAF